MQSMTMQDLSGLRPDLLGLIAVEWDRLRKSGSWWSGTERIAIACEVRRLLQQLIARDSTAERQTAILGEEVVGAVEKIVIDSGRLTFQWFKQLRATGLSVGRYVEMVGVIATVIAIDTFHHALGLPLPAFGEPVAGEPFQVEPVGSEIQEAWVPTIQPERATGELKEFYDQMLERRGYIGNIVKAMSFVPAEQVGFMSLGYLMYMRDLAIGRPQVEFVASTVSAFNDCFY